MDKEEVKKILKVMDNDSVSKHGLHGYMLRNYAKQICDLDKPYISPYALPSQAYEEYFTSPDKPLGRDKLVDKELFSTIFISLERYAHALLDKEVSKETVDKQVLRSLVERSEIARNLHDQILALLAPINKPPVDRDKLREKILDTIAARCHSNLDYPCDCQPQHKQQCWGKIADQILALIDKPKPDVLTIENLDKALEAIKAEGRDPRYCEPKPDICPDCGGIGRLNPDHPNYKWELSNPVTCQCPTCQGTGFKPDSSRLLTPSEIYRLPLVTINFNKGSAGLVDCLAIVEAQRDLTASIKDAEWRKEVAWLDHAWHRWGDKKDAECQARVEVLENALRTLLDKYWKNQEDDYSKGFISCITPDKIPDYWLRARQALKKEEGVARLCARCGAIRTDDIDSDICGSCADDLRTG